MSWGSQSTKVRNFGLHFAAQVLKSLILAMSLRRVVPWSSWDEWRQVYAWLFSKDGAEIEKGLDRVRIGCMHVCFVFKTASETQKSQMKDYLLHLKCY